MKRMAKTSKSTKAKTKTTAKITTKKVERKKARLSIRRPAISLKSMKRFMLPFAAAAAVLLVGIFWYYRVYTDPQKVFWGMVSNNLSTDGVSKISNQNSGQYNSEEITKIAFRPQVTVHNIRDITDHSQGEPTKVKLEAIGAKNGDYQRYIKIDRPAQEGRDKPDYSNVYDKWLKTGENDSQLIAANLFGPFLFGQLTQNSKESVIKQLRTAYRVNYASVKKMNLDGRRTYSFDVEISLKQYATAAKRYAEVRGLNVADQINPDSYSDDTKTNVTVLVDALSRQIKRVQYSSTNSVEEYTSYGLSSNVKPPAKTISQDEFQKAINSVQ